jgi:hypothetical protein
MFLCEYRPEALPTWQSHGSYYATAEYTTVACDGMVSQSQSSTIGTYCMTVHGSRFLCEYSPERVPTWSSDVSYYATTEYSDEVGFDALMHSQPLFIHTRTIGLPKDPDCSASTVHNELPLGPPTYRTMTRRQIAMKPVLAPCCTRSLGLYNPYRMSSHGSTWLCEYRSDCAPTWSSDVSYYATMESSDVGTFYTTWQSQPSFIHSYKMCSHGSRFLGEYSILGFPTWS